MNDFNKIKNPLTNKEYSIFSDEGIKLLHSIQDVYLCDDVTIA